MATRFDTRVFVNGFEAQAQTDIAEMTTSACRANKCPAIVKLADLGEIDIEQLS